MDTVVELLRKEVWARIGSKKGVRNLKCSVAELFMHYSTSIYKVYSCLSQIHYSGQLTTAKNQTKPNLKEYNIKMY